MTNRCVFQVPTEEEKPEEVAEEKPAVKAAASSSSKPSEKAEKTPAKTETKSPTKTPTSTVRRIRVNSSSSNSEDTAPRRCVVTGCKSDARANSVYCSDACIGTHARESLIAMSKEKMKQVKLLNEDIQEMKMDSFFFFFFFFFLELEF